MKCLPHLLSICGGRRRRFRIEGLPSDARTTGILKPTAITEAFQALVRGSGLKIPFNGPHCLRHSFAVQLLKNGTPLKTIGDILGHRTAESTSVYLRLATGDLREVSLPVPGQRLVPGKGARQ